MGERWLAGAGAGEAVSGGITSTNRGETRAATVTARIRLAGGRVGIVMWN